MYRPPRSPEHRPRPRSRSPPPRGYDRAGAWDKDRDSRWQHDRGWDRAGNARHPSRTWGRERSVSPRDRDRPVNSGLSRRSPATSASGALPGRSPIARDRLESTSSSAQQSPQGPVAGWQEGHHGDNSRPLSSGKSGRASLTSSLPVAKELDDFARTLETVLLSSGHRTMARRSLARLSDFVPDPNLLVAAQAAVTAAEHQVDQQLAALQASFGELMRQALGTLGLPAKTKGDVSKADLNKLRERMNTLERLFRNEVQPRLSAVPGSHVTPPPQSSAPPPSLPPQAIPSPPPEKVHPKPWGKEEGELSPERRGSQSRANSHPSANQERTRALLQRVLDRLDQLEEDITDAVELYESIGDDLAIRDYEWEEQAERWNKFMAAAGSRSSSTAEEHSIQSAVGGAPIAVSELAVTSSTRGESSSSTADARAMIAEGSGRIEDSGTYVPGRQPLSDTKDSFLAGTMISSSHSLPSTSPTKRTPIVPASNENEIERLRQQVQSMQAEIHALQQREKHREATIQDVVNQALKGHVQTTIDQAMAGIRSQTTQQVDSHVKHVVPMMVKESNKQLAGPESVMSPPGNFIP